MSVPRKKDDVGRICLQEPEPDKKVEFGFGGALFEKPPSLDRTLFERCRLGFCEAKITAVSARVADQQITWRERKMGRSSFESVSGR